MFFNSPEVIIESASNLGSKEEKATTPIPYMLRLLKDIKSNQFQVEVKKSEVMKAVANARQTILGEDFHTQSKQWGEVWGVKV